MPRQVLEPIPRYLGYRCFLLLIGVAITAWLCVPSNLKLGHRFLDANKPQQATKLLEKALEYESDEQVRSEIQEELSRVELQLGNEDRAIDYQRESVASAPASIKAKVRLSELHDLFCRPREAMGVLAEAVDLFEGWRRQEKPDILDLTRGLRVLAPTDLPSKDRLKERFEEWFYEHRRRLAWYQRWFQEREAAIVTHEALVRDYPNDFDTWFNLARLYGYEGNLEAAQRAMEVVTTLRPDQPYLQDLLAYHYQWNRQPEKVADRLSQAELSREEIRRRIFTSYVQSGRAEEGLGEYVRRYPEDADYRGVRLSLIEVMIEEGDVTGGRKSLENYLEQAPGDRQARESLGELQMITHEYKAAVDTYRYLMEAYPRDRDTYQRLLVDSLDASNDPQGALAELEEIRALQPDNLGLIREIGVRRGQMGKFEQARPDLERAAGIYPGDKTVLYYLAQARSQTGDVQGAATLYEALLVQMGGDESAIQKPPPAETPFPKAAPPTAFGPERRRILVFYKRTEGEAPDRNKVHLWLELVMNHLGLVVDYRAAEDPLPSPEEMDHYRGILTWFNNDRLPYAERFCRWITTQPHLGRPVVFLDRFGCTFDPTKDEAVTPSVLGKLHETMGIKFTGRATENPALIEVDDIDSAVCEMERQLNYEHNYFVGLETVNPENRVYLRLRRKDDPNVICDAVSIGPAGAFCLATYVLFEDQEEFRRQWRVDPFRLIEESFRLDRCPRPDFAVRNGQRLAYIHVDGDGSDASCQWDQPKTCADKFVTEVLEKREWPMTISFIGCLIDPDLFVGETPIATARKIMSNPRVEPGHHSYSHPLNWRSDKVTLDVPGYTKLSLEKEIVGARNLQDREICPKGKPTSLVLWSGSCNPDREAMEIAQKAGLLNMNGGDPRMDGNYPSISHLAPLHRDVGGLLQTYTSGPNDFLITDLWSLPRISFINVLQTFENAVKPRPLVPIDLYFHFYLLAEIAGARALERIFDWLEAHRTALHPITAGEYVRIAQGFRDVTFQRRGFDTWSFAGTGRCLTIRFDGVTDNIDLDRSEGILGFVHRDGSLYVHLDGSGKGAFSLTKSPPSHPYLVSSTTMTEQVRRDQGEISFLANLIGPNRFRFAGMPAGTRWLIDISSLSRDSAPNTLTLQTDQTGTLEIETTEQGIRHFLIRHFLIRQGGRS